MKPQNNRAVKEWAVSCEALAEGKQILLVGKVGFFLLPTYAHQNSRLLQAPFVPRLEALRKEERDPRFVVLNAYNLSKNIRLAILQSRERSQTAQERSTGIWRLTL